MSYISISDARKGELVTTTVKYDGIGLGYLVDGEVFVSTGNGFAVHGSLDVFPVISYDRDGGEGYYAKARKLTGWR